MINCEKNELRNVCKRNNPELYEKIQDKCKKLSLKFVKSFQI